ncbi:MAG: hypothetical protein IKC11_04310 [Clostridia bacterium]|nr:hypothetical protein [Clostridia bacterium]
MKKLEKNKAKKSKRKMLFLVVSKMAIVSLLVGILIIAPMVGVVYHNKQKLVSEKMFGNKAEYQGIVTLWNVDTFEGGTASRSGFLEKVATKFEKQNKGAFIKVENLTIDEMVANLKMGKKPNLFSFGMGISHYLEKDMLALSGDYESRIMSNFLASGMENGVSKAVAWCFGGYSLISSTEKIEKAKGDTQISLKEQCFSLAFDTVYKKSTKHTYSLTFGKNNYVDALSVFTRSFNDKSVNELVDNAVIDTKFSEQSPYDAYVNFVSNKSSILLGTQRDIARMELRVLSGTEQDLIIEPLGVYTDLVDYISIIKSEEKIQNVCKKFVEFLLSEEIQLSLENIGMFSPFGINLYKEGAMQKLENSITEKTVVKNAF